MFRMLRGEDVIESCQLIIVGETSFRIPAVKFFRQFQHVIGVTGLRTIDIVDEIHASLFAREVFATAVATESQRTLARDDIPEIDTGIMIGFVA